MKYTSTVRLQPVCVQIYHRDARKGVHMVEGESGRQRTKRNSIWRLDPSLFLPRIPMGMRKQVLLIRAGPGARVVKIPFPC